MSDTKNRTAVRSELATDTNSHAVEGTGGRAAPGAENLATTRLHQPVTDGLPQFGGYATVCKIGEGGMGSVYLVEDTKLGRKVAIKTLRTELASNPADHERFVREARAAATVEHDNIVPILHIGEAHDGTPFIAMPFLQGEPLDARLRRDPVAPVSLLLKVACEVAEGLAAAHTAGLIHRDIKPANIWLEGDPASPNPALQTRRCKVLDFGLARSVGPGGVNVTATGEILGTPAFMSPEQSRGEHVDARADLFSLGATLYRMATGQLPFDGPTPIAVLIALSADTPRPVRELAPSLPPMLADLIDRLMSKDAGARPQSAAEVVTAVRAMGELSSPASDVESISTLYSRPRPNGDGPGHPTHRPSPWWLPALGLFALVLVGLWNAGVFDAKKPEQAVTEVAQDELPKPPKPPEVLPKFELPKPELPRVELPKAETKKEAELPKPAPTEAPLKAEPKAIVATQSVEPKKAEPKMAEPKMAEPVVAPVVDADRVAAEYVLSVGGAVRVTGGDGDIRAVTELPLRPFRLVSVDLNENKHVTDAGLSVFRGCQAVRILRLSKTPVGDAGLETFKDCKGLTELSLQDTKATDAGLAHLAGCKSLTSLNLGGTKATDAGLVAFKGCKGLVKLDLRGTKVTDTGLVCFGGFENLAYLDLSGTKVTDPGLAAFKGCKNVTFLDLGFTQVSDAGLAHFRDSKHLGQLQLSFAPVSDAGLAHFKGCTKLTDLYLDGTKVTDVALAHFKDCKGLHFIKLDRTKVGDSGLAHLASCTNLTDLWLSSTPVSDAGLAHVKRFGVLTHLHLERTKVTAKGVDDLKKVLPKCHVAWDGVSKK